MQETISKLHQVVLGFRNTSQQHLVRGACNDTTHVCYDGILSSSAQVKPLWFDMHHSSHGS